MTERSINNLFTLRKSERTCSKIAIDNLFKGGHSRSMSAFPVRVVYLISDTPQQEQCQIMVSVPKKCFKRAVKRNRVKRQIREAYRLNKAIVTEQMKKHEGKYLTMAFIWLAPELHDTEEIKMKIKSLLGRISERL